MGKSGEIGPEGEPGIKVPIGVTLLYTTHSKSPQHSVQNIKSFASEQTFSFWGVFCISVAFNVGHY